MGVAEDRISELSDALLLHILSFLPTKCVVSTSILSKRWKYLWTSIPVLDFREWNSGYYYPPTSLEAERFMDFVDRMLSLHDMTNIQKFYIDCELEHIYESRVIAWISTVVQRHNVEELILKYSPSQFPPCVFTCESLTMLELDMDYQDLNLPESISLPRLKILRLTNIEFWDENLTRQFFSNCPDLEELILTDCVWYMEVVCISAPALKRLFINLSGTGDSEGLECCGLNIYAPSLLSLRYIDCVAKDFVQHSLSSLVDAEIGFKFLVQSPREEREEKGYSATKLLENLSNVKLLKMSEDTFEALSFPDGLLTNLPTFHNLIHLEVSLSLSCSLVRTLFDFLQITPNLESLVFARCYRNCLSNDDNGWTLNVVPQCLLLHLKSVEFREFYGSPRDLNVVKLYLKNARVLQRMTILSSSTLSTDLTIKVMKQLLTFPRGSESCEVNFS